MVRWKDIFIFISILYIFGLLLLGIILTILMGPGEIYAIDLNGRTHPDIHYHTIHPEQIELWFQLGIFSIPALIILNFLLPEIKEESSNHALKTKK